MNLQDLINGLKEFKISAFMNIPQNKYSIQNFIKSTFKVMTYEGQKRVVINNPQDPNSVIKIGCSEDGIWDNACEYIMYHSLYNMYQNRTPINGNGDLLTEEDILLFPKCELIGEDPFLLKAERIETPDTLEEYKVWKKEVASLKYHGMSYSDAFLWTEFLLTYQDPVSKQTVLKNDFDKGFKILNAVSIHSDLGYESPLNKGVRRVNGVLRGVFLDLGSCLPIVNNEQRPKCPACGATMGGTLHYHHVPVIDFNAIEKGVTGLVEHKGFYVCNQPSCVNYGTYVLQNYQHVCYVPIELMDLNVFNNFINDIRFNPKKYPSYVTLFYFYTHLVNAPIGMDKTTYYQWLQQNVEQQYLSNNVAFNVSYENYVFKTIASIVNTAYVSNVNNPLASIIFNPNNKIQITNGQLTYSVYKNNIKQALAMFGITGENITCKISAITYLSQLVDGLKEAGNNLTFYSLYDLDQNNFVASLNIYQNVYGQDLLNLHNNLHL